MDALLQGDIINRFMQSQTMCKANIWSEMKPILTLTKNQRISRKNIC